MTTAGNQGMAGSRRWAISNEDMNGEWHGLMSCKLARVTTEVAGMALGPAMNALLHVIRQVSASVVVSLAGCGGIFGCTYAALSIHAPLKTRHFSGWLGWT